jgi:hypothetical protein
MKMKNVYPWQEKMSERDLKRKFFEQYGKHVKHEKDWELDQDNEGYSTLYTDHGKDFFKWDGREWDYVGSKEW